MDTNVENSIPDRNLPGCPGKEYLFSILCCSRKHDILSGSFFLWSQKTWASFSSLFLVKVISIIFALGMPGFPYFILYTNDIFFFFTKHNNLVWGSWQMQFKYFPTESQEQIFFNFLLASQ